MNFSELLLAILSFICFLVIVLFLVVLGWYCVWVLFLSRFRFVRELIGGMSDSPSNESRSNRSRGRIFRKD